MSLRLALIASVPSRTALPAGMSYLASIGSASLIGVSATPFAVTGSTALAGWAFRRANDEICHSLSSEEARAVAATAGRWAIDNLWGNYLLFWREAGGDVVILRSPVTGPAIYHHRDPGAGRQGTSTIAFTDLTLARALGFALDRPDAQGVDAEVRFPLLRGRSTGLADVREILPGEVACLSSGAILPQSWRPWHLKAPPARVRPSALHTEVRRVVSAWSRRFNRIQLELSGGLDSSIVAACLAGRSGDWRAVTLATPDPDGDERVYARAVADRARIALQELLLAGSPADPTAPIPRLRARPGGFGLLAPVDRELRSSAADFKAEAIFTGAGGDNIFGYLTSAAPIVDALRFAGPAAAWRAAGDLARMMNDNIWRALRLAMVQTLRPGRLWPSDTSLLNARFACSRPDHPWFDGAVAIPPGRRTYALKLLAIQPFLDGYDRALELPMIAPLLSQPLVEFGLAVPSWQWGEGGHDRALARAAFAEDIPAAVLARRVKGRIESLFYPSFDRYRAPLRHFLLDGWLASEKLIDCDAIAELIDGKRRADGVAAIRVLHLADIERWVRSIIGH